MEKIRLKTGVLVGVSCRVRALVAGDMDRDVAARRFGGAMGIAFQLQDDSAGGGWGQSETRLRQAPNDLEERKRSLPVVLAGQANPTTVAALLATTGEPATVELLEVLDDLAIRPFGKLRTPPRAQALAQEAAGEALRALKDLHLKPPWEGRFEQLIQFVVARAV